MPKKKRKKFSLQEANALIPELKERLAHLQTKKETYSRLHDALFVHELVSVAEKANGFFEKDDLEENIHALEQAIEDLAKDVEGIFGLGCVLRDIDQGKVEFPATLENEEIFWSWEKDEPAIIYYRSFQDRSPEARKVIPQHILQNP